VKQEYPIHTLTPYFCEIYFDIILSLPPRPPSGFYHSGFPTKILCVFLILLALIILITFDAEDESEAPSYAVFSLRSSSYKPSVYVLLLTWEINFNGTGRFLILYSLIFRFSDTRQENNSKNFPISWNPEVRSVSAVVLYFPSTESNICS
jgi:hypothetical protein